MCQPEEMNSETDDAAFAAIGAELADRVVAVLPKWVSRSVARYVPQADTVAVAVAGENAVAAIQSPLRRLLAADIDQQRGTPLTIIREAVQFPTEVLAAAGVAPVGRDPFTERSFPNDVYDLSPGSWTDIDESLADIGLRWSVAKAFLHRQRHLSG